MNFSNILKLRSGCICISKFYNLSSMNISIRRFKNIYRWALAVGKLFVLNISVWEVESLHWLVRIIFLVQWKVRFPGFHVFYGSKYAFSLQSYEDKVLWFANKKNLIQSFSLACIRYMYVKCEDILKISNRRLLSMLTILLLNESL